jgi:mRNA interferase RelE/StbE
MVLDLSKDSRDFLAGLQAKQFKQVASRILALQRDSYPADAKHLAGHPGRRRIDCGEYRVCYAIVGSVVQIIVVGKRNDDDVYRRLARKS